MALGFARPTSGLIVDLPGQPFARSRFTIDFARAYADTLTVVVCGSPIHDASADSRIEHFRTWYPGVEFIASIAPSCVPDTAVETMLAARRFDLLFSPDLIDEFPFAIDRSRRVPTFPDGALRLSPTATPSSRLRPAHAPLLRVCLFGPESTGKSTLADGLAQHYRTAYAADYVRAYLDAVGSTGSAHDVPWIARGQIATEAAVAAQAERLLITDTSLASIALWSDVLYGTTAAWIHEQADRQRYDLWLLTDIDVPFEPDPLRCFPDGERRTAFMAQCRRVLERLGVEPLLLRSGTAERLQLACSVIDPMLSARA